MNRLRVSYTLLNLWRAGRFQDALDYYQKKPLPVTPAMEMGKQWDDYVNQYVVEHNAMPPEFGGDALKNPRPQMKIEVPFNEMCDVVIVPDILTDDTLWENKTGNSKDSADYCQDFQVSMYLMALELKGIVPEKAIICHYDQYSQTHDKSLIWNTPEERERGRNFIETLSPEIHSFFSAQGLL